MSANDIVVVSLKYSGINRFLNLNQYKLLAIHVYTLYLILNEIKSIFDTVEVQCLCAYYIARLISMHVTACSSWVCQVQNFHGDLNLLLFKKLTL